MTDNIPHPTLSLSHPGIQTSIETVRSSARPAIFLPVPIGYTARQRNYIPEMKGMSTRLDAIAHAIIAAFGVVGARSAVNATNVYHSSDEFDTQASSVDRLGERYRQSMLPVLEKISEARAAIRIPATVACLLAGKDSANVLAEYRVPIKLVSSINLQRASDFFEKRSRTMASHPEVAPSHPSRRFITWTAMKRFLVDAGAIDTADLMDEDPRGPTDAAQV